MDNENENVVEQDDIAIIDELNARHQAEHVAEERMKNLEDNIQK